MLPALNTSFPVASLSRARGKGGIDKYRRHTQSHTHTDTHTHTAFFSSADRSLYSTTAFLPSRMHSTPIASAGPVFGHTYTGWVPTPSANRRAR